jgi:puromycin-sensitive aminopeptidase
VTRQLFTPLHELLGWDARDGEAQQAPRLRSVVLLALGTTGRDETVRAEALRRFEAGHVEGDLASTIISIVGEISRPTDFDELLKRFQEAKDPQAEQRYLFGLARFNSRELTERAFHLCLTETVRTQDAPYLVSALLANRDSGARVFDLLVEHWDECLDRFPTNSHNRMVSGISSIISSADVAKGIDAFLTDHPVKAGQRSVLQSIERMWTGVSFAERERPALDQTLRGFLSAP